MSSAIEDIRAKLTAQASVTDLVGQRIYPNVAPDGVIPASRGAQVPPFVVLTVITDTPENSFTGTAATRLSVIHLQVDVYASSYLTARGAADAVDAVISDLTGPDLSAIRENGTESWEDETGLHRISGDYAVMR